MFNDKKTMDMVQKNIEEQCDRGELNCSESNISEDYVVEDDTEYSGYILFFIIGIFVMAYFWLTRKR